MFWSRLSLAGVISSPPSAMRPHVDYSQTTVSRVSRHWAIDCVLFNKYLHSFLLRTSSLPFEKNDGRRLWTAKMFIYLRANKDRTVINSFQIPLGTSIRKRRLDRPFAMSAMSKHSSTYANNYKVYLAFYSFSNNYYIERKDFEWTRSSNSNLLKDQERSGFTPHHTIKSLLMNCSLLESINHTRKFHFVSSLDWNTIQLNTYFQQTLIINETRPVFSLAVFHVRSKRLNSLVLVCSSCWNLGKHLNVLTLNGSRCNDKGLATFLKTTPSNIWDSGTNKISDSFCFSDIAPRCLLSPDSRTRSAPILYVNSRFNSW